MPLIIFKPERRLCTGKSVRYPITKLDPFLWLQHNDLRSISVDGYTVNSNGEVTALLSRYEYDGPIVNREEFTKTLTANFQNEIETQLVLANLLNIPFRLFVWPKDYPANSSTSAKKIIVYFPKFINEQLNLSTAKLINLNGLEAGIRKYRGRSYKSVKSLQSANSNLECHLANHTHNPWPGDIDGVLMGKENNKVVSIIEFKTHNIDSPIGKEYIGKYGQQDWRRFEVLYKLQTAIEKAQGSRPKLYFIVWGTRDIDNHKKIKIDKINQGKVRHTTFIDRPKFGLFSNELLSKLTSQ